jgi:PIN domain nuclease of toxin-antitoxin system
MGSTKLKILLDTHVLIHMHIDRSLVSIEQMAALEAAAQNQSIFLSAISFWEILQLEKRGRLIWEIPTEKWLQELEHSSDFNIIPINTAIALESHRVPADFPKDPADRFIAATAKVLGLKLLTNDQKIIDSEFVPTI